MPGPNIPAPTGPRLFSRFSSWAARATGRPAMFLMAFGAIVAWACVGPFLGFSDTWQLTVNTATTIVTFLMVFIIQNTQTRDMEAMQVKLDELVRSNPRARTELLDLEELPEERLHALQVEYEALAAAARKRKGVGEGGGRPTVRAGAAGKGKRRAGDPPKRHAKNR